MKKSDLQVYDVEANIRKHVKRIGVGILTFSLCTSTAICLLLDGGSVGHQYKGITVSRELGIEDTIPSVSKAPYNDVLDRQMEYAELARLEGLELVAEDEAISAERQLRNQLAVAQLAEELKATVVVADLDEADYEDDLPYIEDHEGEDADDDEYGDCLGTFVITAYCPCKKCCGKTDGRTASGVMARPNHTIAASPEYAFGTKLVIGGTVYTVEDRGGAIKGKRIDIFFATHSQALRFGRKSMKVYRYTGN